MVLVCSVGCGDDGGMGTPDTSTGTTTDTGTTGTVLTGSSNPDTSTVDTETVDTSTGDTSDAHQMLCQQASAGVGLHGGFAVPGVAGAPRWGIPPMPPVATRMRRSWSSLSPAEKQEVVDAFIALKFITVDSGDPGSARADYNSFCDELGLGGYSLNLYDYYVESHANAFVSMMTPEQPHTSMAHMGPQFLPWHRYLLLRLEVDMGEAIGDPDFALPYWDWTDCHADGDPSICEPIFESNYLGTQGSCDMEDAAVEGYMVDQGFLTNIFTNGESSYDPASIVCGQRPIQRSVGCFVPAPGTAAEITAMFDRPAYDDAPYDSCNTEEDVSFRQYLEGFDNESEEFLCVAAGCGLHGLGHVYVGGDMFFSSANPNDPIFFLHHANVDRMWAAWQEANLASGDAGRMVDSGNPEYPEGWRGPLFNWPEVQAEELFDYRALGYEYDVLPAGE